VKRISILGVATAPASSRWRIPWQPNSPCVPLKSTSPQHAADSRQEPIGPHRRWRCTMPDATATPDPLETLLYYLASGVLDGAMSERLEVAACGRARHVACGRWPPFRAARHQRQRGLTSLRRRRSSGPHETGQVVPFFAPSRPLAYPPVPVSGPRNRLPIFGIRCATMASC